MESLWVVALGWREGELTLGAIETLRGAKRIVLKTGRLPAADWLRGASIEFSTLDALYDRAADFDELVDSVADEVARLSDGGGLVYGVSQLTDRTVGRLIERMGERVRLIPGVAAEAVLTARSGAHYRVFPAGDVGALVLSADVPTLITEIDHRVLAGEVKLRLSEFFPDEWMIELLDPDGRCRSIRLCELDRLERYDHRLCALIPAAVELSQLTRYDFNHLNQIMRILRGPDGCSWDRAQTHRSLRANVVEEAYEVVDAIDRGDMVDLYDELGDLLLQVALHAQIAMDHGDFDIMDVTTAICAKMITRHPHIFADEKAESPEEVSVLWQRIKHAEKQQSAKSEAMRGVAGAMPALMRAEKSIARAGDVGFQANLLLNGRSVPQTEAALGEALFSLVAAARSQKLQPELALSGAIERFIARFERLEALSAADKRPLSDLSPGEMEALWARAE